MNEKLLYEIALSLFPGIGPVIAKNLIAYCGSAEAVFREKEKYLLKVPKIGEIIAGKMMKENRKAILLKAEKEMKFISDHQIRALFFTDEGYPQRMKFCDDSPIMVYTKGPADLNPEKVLAIVGTRNATEYGRMICEKIIRDLASEDVMVLSGLAYGIDITAHKAAMNNGLPTVAVLAHGLDKLYPPLHQGIAQEMLVKGALLTEYTSLSPVDKENFPTRNRIVAGMADAVLVIESGKKGGSLITAEIANSYNRDVFAIPGKIGDIYSAGCHALIKSNKAALVESAQDIIFQMGWERSEKEKKAVTVQRNLFPELKDEEKVLYNILLKEGKSDVDSICILAKITSSKAASLLLNMEFSGIVRSLPGKMYQLL